MNYLELLTPSRDQRFMPVKWPLIWSLARKLFGTRAVKREDPRNDTGGSHPVIAANASDSHT